MIQFLAVPLATCWPWAHYLTSPENGDSPHRVAETVRTRALHRPGLWSELATVVVVTTVVITAPRNLKSNRDNEVNIYTGNYNIKEHGIRVSKKEMSIFELWRFRGGMNNLQLWR